MDKWRKGGGMKEEVEGEGETAVRMISFIC